MFQSRSLRLVFLFSFLLQFTTADRKCYALNGTELGSTFGACNSTAEHSGCCAIRGSPGMVDLCLSNGLCMATNQEYMGTIWQSGCTDPTGMDPSCPKMCPDARDDFNNGSSVPAWNVQMCDYGTYCCRAPDDRKNCCDNATAPHVTTTFLGAFQFETSTAGASSTSSAASAISSSSLSSATSTSTAAPTDAIAAAASSASSLPTASSDADLCAAEKRRTGIVGGTLAGFFSAIIVCLLGAIFFLFQREKRQRKLKEHYEAQFATNSWAMQSRNTVVENDPSRTGGEKGTEVRYIGRVNT